MDNNTPRGSFVTLPAAIIIAAAIIGIAIIYVKKPIATAPVANDDQKAASIQLAPVTAADHILGNPNAAIKIVEYSDPSCPYCKTFNPTMTAIMDKYGPTGDVAWIYRHYPLDKPGPEGQVLHPNANHEAQAMECAASLGGNDIFWKFEKALYTATPSVTQATPNGLDQKKLPDIAKSVGLDVVSFNECLTSGQFKDKVEAEYTAGVNAGVSGTPTNFFVLSGTVDQKAIDYVTNALIQYKISPELLHASPDKKIIVMAGAMPVDMISGLISTLIGK